MTSLLRDTLIIGLRFTIIVRPGAVGGCGGVKLRGGFTTRGMVFHPAQEPPGCHAQPWLGRKSQEPYRYGIHPHGYADTQV